MSADPPAEKKAPTSNIQHPEKLQYPSSKRVAWVSIFGCWSLEFHWSLDVEVWSFHHGLSIIETVTYVPVPACEWIRPRRAYFTCKRSLPKCLPMLCCNCQNTVTACMSPVAPTG